MMAEEIDVLVLFLPEDITENYIEPLSLFSFLGQDIEPEYSHQVDEKEEEQKILIELPKPITPKPIPTKPPLPPMFTLQQGPECCMLLETWKEHMDVSKWLISEKLDGIRCVWTGNKFMTRQGNYILAPWWFTEQLPPYALDGELWMGRGVNLFNELNGLIKGDHRAAGLLTSEWRFVKFMIFDVPISRLSYITRHRIYLHGKNFGPHASLVPQVILKTQTQLSNYLKQVRLGGGEGLVARDPQGQYVFKRSKTILKIKCWDFDYAQIQTIYHKGMCACYNSEGDEFHMYVPNPKIDQVFVYKCLGRASCEPVDAIYLGLPRFPTYVAPSAYPFPKIYPPLPPSFHGVKTTNVPMLLNKV